MNVDIYKPAYGLCLQKNMLVVDVCVVRKKDNTLQLYCSRQPTVVFAKS